MKGFMLIDMSMLMYRCMHRMDDEIKNSKGLSTGLEFGSLRSLQGLGKKYPDHKIVLCFDSKTDKRDIDENYKANRSEMQDTTKLRIGVFQGFCKKIYAWSSKDGLEADDVMFSLSTLSIVQNESFERRLPLQHYIYTNDNDLLQAVSGTVTVLKSFRSNLYEWGPDKVLEKYGVVPERLPLFRAFAGDSSDNLPGVNRIPKKKLAAFVNSLEESTPDCTVANDIDMFSENMQAEIIAFTSMGQLDRNYKLMHLTYQHCEIIEPSGEEISTMLKYWEIFSLNICKELVDLSNEEF